MYIKVRINSAISHYFRFCRHAWGGVFSLQFNQRLMAVLKEIERAKERKGERVKERKSERSRERQRMQYGKRKKGEEGAEEEEKEKERCVYPVTAKTPPPDD